jgi:ABC-2 type transport system ATP-binding protein
VLFLDEPTTGLDPRGRNEVWEQIRALVDAGATVLLTTQYLEEADQLANQIAVIDAGRVIASGSPDELKLQLGGDRIDVVLRHGDDLTVAGAIIARAAGAEATVDRDTRRISAPVHDRVIALTKVARGLDAAGIAAEDIVLRRPTLDEVFLHLTRHHAENSVQKSEESAA